MTTGRTQILTTPRQPHHTLTNHYAPPSAHSHSIGWTDLLEKQLQPMMWRIKGNYFRRKIFFYLLHFMLPVMTEDWWTGSCEKTEKIQSTAFSWHTHPPQRLSPSSRTEWLSLKILHDRWHGRDAQIWCISVNSVIVSFSVSPIGKLWISQSTSLHSVCFVSTSCLSLFILLRVMSRRTWPFWRSWTWMTTSSPGSQRCHRHWRSSRWTTTSSVHSALVVSKVGFVSVYKGETFLVWKKYNLVFPSL